MYGISMFISINHCQWDRHRITYKSYGYRVPSNVWESVQGWHPWLWKSEYKKIKSDATLSNWAFQVFYLFIIKYLFLNLKITQLGCGQLSQSCKWSPVRHRPHLLQQSPEEWSTKLYHFLIMLWILYTVFIIPLDQPWGSPQGWAFAAVVGNACWSPLLGPAQPNTPRRWAVQSYWCEAGSPSLTLQSEHKSFELWGNRKLITKIQASRHCLPWRGRRSRCGEGVAAPACFAAVRRWRGRQQHWWTP